MGGRLQARPVGTPGAVPRQAASGLGAALSEIGEGLHRAAEAQAKLNEVDRDAQIGILANEHALTLIQESGRIQADPTIPPQTRGEVLGKSDTLMQVVQAGVEAINSDTSLDADSRQEAVNRYLNQARAVMSGLVAASTSQQVESIKAAQQGAEDTAVRAYALGNGGAVEEMQTLARSAALQAGLAPGTAGFDAFVQDATADLLARGQAERANTLARANPDAMALAVVNGEFDLIPAEDLLQIQKEAQARKEAMLKQAETALKRTQEQTFASIAAAIQTGESVSLPVLGEQSVPVTEGLLDTLLSYQLIDDAMHQTLNNRRLGELEGTSDPRVLSAFNQRFIAGTLTEELVNGAEAAGALSVTAAIDFRTDLAREREADKPASGPEFELAQGWINQVYGGTSRVSGIMQLIGVGGGALDIEHEAKLTELRRRVLAGEAPLKAGLGIVQGRLVADAQTAFVNESERFIAAGVKVPPRTPADAEQMRQTLYKAIVGDGYSPENWRNPPSLTTLEGIQQWNDIRSAADKVAAPLFALEEFRASAGVTPNG